MSPSLSLSLFVLAKDTVFFLIEPPFLLNPGYILSDPLIQVPQVQINHQAVRVLVVITTTGAATLKGDLQI